MKEMPLPTGMSREGAAVLILGVAFSLAAAFASLPTPGKLLTKQQRAPIEHVVIPAEVTVYPYDEPPAVRIRLSPRQGPSCGPCEFVG